MTPPSKPSASDTLDRLATLGNASAERYDTLDAAVTQGRGATILGGQYRVVRKLGEGGMGVVYLAEDKEMGNRPVAVKVLPPLLARNLRAVENLRKEAMVAINLTHPNIIRLYGFHTDGDLKFLVMEYIDGQTLEERILQSERGRLSVEEVLPLMMDKEGQVKLLDFGIARELKDSFTRVTGQETSGTIPYMSPQQLNGDTPNASMDIYSLGVTLYECLSGHTPFYTGDLKHQILTKRPPEITDLPEHVNQALQGALAKEASDRPATATDLVLRLENASPLDRELPQALAPQHAADADAVTERIRKWVENRKGEWTQEEWKDFVIGLFDDGCAVGLAHKNLETVREKERKAWIKAEAARKAEEARMAEERRRAAEEAERKRREAEEARKRREEEQLLDEIQSRPTIPLCERYLRDYPAGRQRTRVEKVLGRLRGERKNQMRAMKAALVLAAITLAAVLVGVSVSRLEKRGRLAPQRGDAAPAASAPRPQPLEAIQGAGGTRASSGSSRTQAGPSQEITNSIGMKLVWIPPGEFLMGSPQSEEGRFDGEGPQHRVTLTRGFYLGVYEVTQRQWLSVMGRNPSGFQGDDLPVETVSWEEAVEFCRKLSVKEGVAYRLPTEAEWEYACRAGTTGRYGFGDSDSSLGEYAWYESNSGNQTHAVGQKRPNAWGLHDMHGNVWEWCQDWYGEYASGSVPDPLGPASGGDRVSRGGSWLNGARDCRSAFRAWDTPDDRGSYLGFRLARTTPSYP
ncbi:MAG: bifunctional serine/threonine-protein kinase/formylglycine-generating enzyme family protein [Planctomycetes bacterium]|nr:bifunctional serine/threonine-protein kinase/formylglycine-generating enzyme family protein [Planctomycetota bacterium]